MDHASGRVVIDAFPPLTVDVEVMVLDPGDDDRMRSCSGFTVRC